MTRLEILSPELAGKLQRASAAKQHAASLAASEFATIEARVEHPLVEEALSRMRAAGVLTPKERAEIEALAARLDEEYFDLQEAAEEGRAGADDYLRPFAQARAVSAILNAFKDDPFEASTEAVYEAAAVTDEPAKLFSVIDAVLR